MSKLFEVMASLNVRKYKRFFAKIQKYVIRSTLECSWIICK